MTLMTRILVVAAALCLAGICQATVVSADDSRQTASIPSWLPEESRFAVEGASSEIAQAEHVLALMRERIHPKLWKMMEDADQGDARAAKEADNGYPSLLGPTLQWIVHVSLPAVTNEAAYFDSYTVPLAASAFDLNLLTNRAARLSYLPPIVKLSLIFDNVRRESQVRAIPGVDYPGVSYEDEESTPRALRLTLRAPGKIRSFNVRLQAWPKVYREVEFKWVMSPYAAIVRSWGPDKTNLSEDKKIITSHTVGKQRKTSFVAFFVREKGAPIWSAPSFVYISPDDLGRHTYDKKGLLDSIDYGTFRDVYKYDEKNRVIGFTRFYPDTVRGQDYSNLGEQIVETYSDDQPKITRKVKYAVVDGKLSFEVLDGDIYHKNEPIQFRRY